MKEPLDLEIKRKIYNIIKKNPGLHESKIAEMLDISWELVYYHINYLEKNNLITVTKEKGYNRCFTEGEIGVKDRKTLSIIRQKIPLAIIHYLLARPYSKFKEISDNIDVLPTTIAYHLKKLVKADVVEFELVKSRKRYLVKDSKYIIQLLIRYKPQSLIDDYEDMWKDFSWSKDLFKKF